MDQQPLYDPAAERAVLAGLFQHGNEAFYDVSDVVSTKSFSSQNAVIYKCMNQALEDNEQIDDATLLSAAYTLGFGDHFEDAEEKRYIQSLKILPIRPENIRKQAIKLRKLELGRECSKKLQLAQEEIQEITGAETVNDILSIVERPILDLTTHIEDSDKPKKIGEGIHDYIEQLKENQGHIVGISSSYARLDAAIGGGWRRKTVSLICARMGIGKSMLADNFAMHAAIKLGIPVLMLDTEMSEEDHKNRMLANLSQIPTNNIELGYFAPPALKKAGDIIEEMPYSYVSVADKSFEELLSICRRWILKEVGVDENGRTNDCLIVYDYFKLMHSSSLNNMAEYQALGFQISSLHNFCVKYDVPVVSFVQTNRDGIDTEDTSIVAQSDRLAWLATVLVLFKAKTDEEIAENPELGNRKMVVLKGRHGGGMDRGDYINYYMDGSIARIKELPTRYEARAMQEQDTGFDGTEGSTADSN